jgi:hypothetical protein
MVTQRCQILPTVLAVATFLTTNLAAQVTTGQISGIVLDPTHAAVSNAVVTARNLETNAARKIITDREGLFAIPELPVSSYEVAVEKAGFAKYVQGPIILRVSENADLRVELTLASLTDKVTVSDDAPLLNTANAEVGANYDRRRISELPLGPNHNVDKLALSVAGVNPFQTGQNTTIMPNATVVFSVDGGRVRSNNFTIDGQDVNNIHLGGEDQRLNNPDAIAEFRLVTNQVAPEFGQGMGGMVSVITKSGGNQPHGSAFWVHNDNHLNSRSNLEKQALSASPYRIENEFGGTFGGPIVKDKTFFFGSLERWTDRRLGTATTIRGVPTEQGRALLESLAGTRQSVRMLLDNLPPAQAAVPGLSAPVTVSGQTAAIPLGILTGASNIAFDAWQWSDRVDHRLSERNTIGGRYLFDDSFNFGDGQITPVGLNTVSKLRRQSAAAFVNSALRPTIFNELRFSFHRSTTDIEAVNPDAARIPSVEVNELGLRGFQDGPTRTGIGLASTLPRVNRSNIYQAQDNLAVVRGAHSLKFGADFGRRETAQLFAATLRGRLVYNTLQNLVDDTAQLMAINPPLPGGSPWYHYRYYDAAFFAQDQWRVRRNLSLTYGLRYELPRNPASDLLRNNQSILEAAGGDPRFSVGPLPGRDLKDWAPRFGFSYQLSRPAGWLGRVIGEDKTVLRGGYSRTYDLLFNTAILGQDQYGSFPFVKSVSLSAVPNAVAALQAAAVSPVAGDVNLLKRAMVSPDMRSSHAEQFSLQLQRQLKTNWVLNIGYVGTKGTALLETVDANPTLPGSAGRQRLDPTRGVLLMKCNCTSSIYHSLQASVEKRLSSNFSMAAHYTWSSFIDGASDILNPSPTGEIGFPQNSFNRSADRGRSAWDRPQRVAVNGVFELPFFRQQKGALGKILGGWQATGFLTLQSGAPFSVLDGSDPGLLLSGLATTVRANLNTNLDVSRMSIEQILAAGGARLFSHVTAANPLGNMGRNMLRSSRLTNLDLGVVRNMRFLELHTLQLRAEFYNTSNTRYFGIPDATLSSANFLNQWGTDGGNRRIVFTLRYAF